MLHTKHRMSIRIYLMIKLLHFADAHIDMANYGRHDPETGLPMRVLDFLKSLDTIVDAAIREKVDLVLFAGDAYKDRNPVPTFQREWGKRIMRLSKAKIPTVLLVGNHDLSPTLGRAHAIEEFTTLEVPHIQVIDRPTFLGPEQLEALPLQIIAFPWISRSGMMAHLGLSATNPAEIFQQLEERLGDLLMNWLTEADPNLPVVLAAHFSVQGAKFGVERAVMLGGDIVLPASLVKDPRLSYVALGHIHKPQDLNAGNDPPVIYPGSIERIDFGEVNDEKFFVVAGIEVGKKTQVEWRKLEGIRPFIDRKVRLEAKEEIGQRLLEALPSPEELAGAVVRLTIEYPRDWDDLIDEAALREHARDAFEFHLVKHPVIETRVRLPEDESIGSKTALELLSLYMRSAHIPEEEQEELARLAGEIIKDEG